ncbi:HAD family hydrolase [Mucilaginibacter paludis]|uniref:HAD-superfamily hydrolase, subfamily IA, variant 3 n=1 Tax=Mucilaginibacter paludis DSM 18603 TaxID=714943 RepID=H1YAB9_9SPHI|nr:HAD family phosphatase [Mucilaginibacter paludis]EHQ26962.1 HAD-superfamily hydrolase, subfamily IA, variant 3 [Mucilaginibacter paludis DSM 18603]
MINTIIFDLGNVLIDWNPYHLYRKIFDSDTEIQHFLETVCTMHWNEEQDAGRAIQAGTEILVGQFPEHEANIRAYYGRWDEMLGGGIEGTVNIFKKLKDSSRYKIYALTNWSAETFQIPLKQYDFLHWFDAIVVSGDEGLRKPDPRFYQLLLDRYEVKPEEALFIDDNYRNILAAREMGIQSIHFTSPEDLNTQLGQLNLL